MASWSCLPEQIHFFDVSAKELAKRATLRYGLPRKLAPILETSGRWGRIKGEIVCSMTSKHAITLYELIQLRANLDRCVETISIERFRELLGVPPGAYARSDNFQRKVVEPSLILKTAAGIKFRAKADSAKRGLPTCFRRFWPESRRLSPFAPHHTLRNAASPIG